VLLVLEEGKTLRDDAVQAVELLQSSGQNLLGTVLNKSIESNEYYGY